MQVEKFTNSIFASNSYLVFKNNNKNVWVIDPGDSAQILNRIKTINKNLIGILLTHAHIDHIYGVNDLIAKFPDLKLYTSEYSMEGLFSPKINHSYYMERSFIVACKNIKIVFDNSQIEMFDDEKTAKVLYTPGHNRDCVSYNINKYIFTGDALMPDFKIHTRSKYGDKVLAKDSIYRIINNFNGDTVICPGHGKMTLLKEVKMEELLNT